MDCDPILDPTTKNRHGRPRLPVACVAAIAAALCCFPAHAAEWTVAPAAEVGAHYNDNARLNEGGSGDIVISGGFLDFGVLAQRRTERAAVLVRPRVSFREYPGDDDESSDSQYLDFRANSRGQRSRWDVVANFSQEQVIRGEDVDVEFPDPEIGDPDVGETGRLTVDSDRTIWRVGPSFSYELNQRTDAGIAVNYLDVSYDEVVPGESVDYTDSRAEVFLQRILAPESRLRAALFVSEYEADDISNKSTSYGLTARYERDISETFNVFFGLGLQETDIEVDAGPTIDDSSSSYLMDAGFMRSWERTRLRAEIGRSVLPAGSGFLQQNDRLRVSLSHQFRPRWYGEFAGVAQQTDSVDDTVDLNDRDYYQVRATLGHDLTRTVALEFSYARTFQDYSNTSGDADANELFLLVRYAPRGAVWSR